MARFRERFEVKNEMQDGGKIRQDDKDKTGGKSSKQTQEEIQEEINSVGFDDWEDISDEVDIDDNEQEQNSNAIDLDEKGNPVIPDDWTYLIHGSSKDRWDATLLGNDFVVGNGKSNGQDVKNRPLCCVERSDAQFNYERRGSNTAKAYGGKNDSFEIRVVLYKNPRLGEGKNVREKLNPEELKDVSKYYMYQDGRHPAVPSGTKLVFLKSSDFDEITNTNGNNILWYVPEEYLEQYLSDVEQMKNIDSKAQIETDQEVEETEQVEITRDEKEEKKIEITNLDVEQELEKYYDDSVDIVTLKAYLKEKIPQIYGDRLEKFGIDIDKYLEDHKQSLEYFEGAESYKEMVAELDSYLELLEEAKDVDKGKVIADNKETEQLETKLDEKEERRTLKNEVRDVGEEEIYEQGDGKETDFVLKSVNGKDVLSSAIEATESMTRNSMVVEQAKTINIVQKERSEVAKDTQII